MPANLRNLLTRHLAVRPVESGRLFWRHSGTLAQRSLDFDERREASDVLNRISGCLPWLLFSSAKQLERDDTGLHPGKRPLRFAKRLRCPNDFMLGNRDDDRSVASLHERELDLALRQVYRVPTTSSATGV